MPLFARRTKRLEAEMAEMRAAVVATVESLLPGIGDVWTTGGVDTHPALMIPASIAAVNFVTQTLVGADPIYEEKRSSGRWVPTEDIEKIPYWLRPEDHHPNSLQTYDDMIGDLVVSIMISHGAYVIALGPPGDVPRNVQTIPSWAGSLDRKMIDGKEKDILRIDTSRTLTYGGENESVEFERYDQGMGGNYIYLSLLRWGSIPYGVDTVASNIQTFRKHLSAIKTSHRFAKNPMPSLVVETETDSEGSYTDDGSAVKRLKEQIASIGKDPDNPALATTEVQIRKIHELKQSVGDIGLSEIIARSAADMGTVFGVFDTFLSAGKSSTWGTIVRDLDRVVQSHKINPLKKKIQRAFSLMCDPGFRVRFDGTDLRPETPRELADRLGGLVDDGLLTPNEGRSQMSPSMEPHEGDNADKLREPRATRRPRGTPEEYQNNDENSGE